MLDFDPRASWKTAVTLRRDEFHESPYFSSVGIGPPAARPSDSEVGIAGAAASPDLARQPRGLELDVLDAFAALHIVCVSHMHPAIL